MAHKEQRPQQRTRGCSGTTSTYLVTIVILLFSCRGSNRSIMTRIAWIAAYLVVVHFHGRGWAAEAAAAAFAPTSWTSSSSPPRPVDDACEIDLLPHPRRRRRRTAARRMIGGTYPSLEAAAASANGHPTTSLIGDGGHFKHVETRRTRQLQAAINGERHDDASPEQQLPVTAVASSSNTAAAAAAAGEASAASSTDGKVAVEIGSISTAKQLESAGDTARRNSVPPPPSAMSAFDLVASLAYRLIVESDKRRDAVTKTSAGSSATNWIDEQSSFYLQKALDKLELNDGLSSASTRSVDVQTSAQWTRWMKSAPCPAILDLSSEFRTSILRSIRMDAIIGTGDGPTLDNNVRGRHQTEAEELARQVLPRLGCRILLLPSGTELNSPLLEPTASLILGKLLFGGATRYRRLYASSSSSNTESSSTNIKSPPRNVGVRTEIMTKPSLSMSSDGSSKGDGAPSLPPPPPPPSWCMFGGLERMYEAVDMGGCAILEVVVLPLGKVHDPTLSVASSLSPTKLLPVPHLRNSQHPPPLDPTNAHNNNLLMLNVPWKPADMLVMRPDPDDIDAVDSATNTQGRASTTTVPAPNYDEMLDGAARNDAFVHDFSATVGGLRPQIDTIVRRVLDGRMIRPVDELGSSNPIDNSNTNPSDPTLALDAEELSALGLMPVRGLLLHGPPGTGKTLLAREISKALRARAPKIVSAPELLDRWVGGSEKAVRALFADAESELAACDNNPGKSALHVVVIDEIDAVFRHRSSTAHDSGEATRSSVVNQILAKLDGVNAIPNVLVIGMTNRRELLDDALLRPGRLEVQIEIPLPTREGRREVLQIHFGPLRRKGRLSDPLCRAIDGAARSSSEYSRLSTSDAPMRKRDHLHLAWRNLSDRILHVSRRRLNPLSISRHYDLADATRGYSGADLAGLVRCAGSIALSRARRDGTGVNGLFITLEDVKQALKEVKS